MKTTSLLFAFASLVWFSGSATLTPADSSSLSTAAIKAKNKKVAVAETNISGTTIMYYKLTDGTINAILPVINVHP